MLQVVKCPACAAPLECDGDNFEKCDFCGSKVAVNQHNSFSQNAVGFAGILKNAQQLKEVLRLTQNGNKLAAIKLYREMSNCGLAEAKDAVEKLQSGKSLSFQNVSFSHFGAENLNDFFQLAKQGNNFTYQPIGGSDGFGFYSTPKNKKPVKNLSGFNKLIVFLILAAALAGVGVAIYSLVSPKKQILQKIVPILNSTPQNNSRVNAFAEENLRFGGEGTGTGKFADNRTIAVDGKGMIYSSDYQNGRVQIFDKEGRFVTQWFLQDREKIHYSLAVNKKGHVFVTQPGGLISAYEGMTGKVLNQARLNLTSSLYPTPDGKIIAASQNDILLIDEKLKVVSTFKNAAQSAGLKDGLNYLAVNGLGEIFATIDGGRDLVKFSADGKFIDRFKIQPTMVHDLAISPKGQIFITDTTNVYVYQADGSWVTSFPANQCFALTFNEEGELLAAIRPFIVKYSLNQ